MLDVAAGAVVVDDEDGVVVVFATYGRTFIEAYDLKLVRIVEPEVRERFESALMADRARRRAFFTQARV